MIVRGLVIIPAYNEARSLPGVLDRVRAARLTEDVVVVSDGSIDGTERIAAAHGVPYLRHPVNLGYVRAVQTGVRFADAHGYDYVVMLDADGQHDPAAVPALTAPIRAGSRDVVIGSRFVVPTGYRAPLGRRLGMRVFSSVTALLGSQRVHDTTSGYKAIARRAFPVLTEQALSDYHAETLILCMRAGLRVAEVPVRFGARTHGASMYGLLDAVVYPLKTLLAIALLAARPPAAVRAAAPQAPDPEAADAR